MRAQQVLEARPHGVPRPLPGGHERVERGRGERPGHDRQEGFDRREVHDRLAARIPEQGAATLVHGDYRLDNMILSASGEVAAVVDWELCTLGDPLADVGMLLVYWGAEGDALMPLMEPATIAPGFPDRDQVKSRYAERSGRDLSEIDFYVALGLWKLAIILQGVHARFAAGQYGSGDDGQQFAEIVGRLAEAASDAERRLA